MRNILGKKTAVKLLTVLFNNPKKSFKEIELIQKAKTGKGAAATTINNLVKENILTEHRIGKTKLLTLNTRSNQAFALKHFFDQQKLDNMSSSKLAALFFFKNNVPCELLIVFGSTIAGTAKEQSDIDLYIETKQHKKVKEAQEKTEELFGEKINLHYHEKTTDPFLRNILGKGVILRGYDKAKALLKGQADITRIQFFLDRLKSSKRNIQNKDPKTAKEILKKLEEQMIYYVLTEKNIPYTSKQDAEKAIAKIPEGKIFLSCKTIKEQIQLYEESIMKMLQHKIIRCEGYAKN